MKKIFIITILLSVILCGCSVEYNDDDTNITAEINEITEPDFADWISVSDGLDLKQYVLEDQNLITVVRVDNEKYKWAISQSETPSNINSWINLLKAAGEEAVLVINGGYFDEANQSTGYLKIGEDEFGKFSSNGNNGYTGMFSVKNGLAKLHYLPQENITKKYESTYALQTFPTLVWNGKGLIKEDSGQTARRTVLAQDASGQIYIVINELYMSLYQLSEWLINSELKIDKAINLDGGTSTGIVIDTKEFNYLVNSAPVPNVIYLKQDK